MEKRGYVKAGPWTPEVVMENPEAGDTKKTQFQVDRGHIALFFQRPVSISSLNMKPV